MPDDIPVSVPEIDPLSRDILGLRPDIHFVEPDVIEGVPEAITEIVADQALSNMNKARDLADVVGKLAEATQLRVDKRAAPMTVALDPRVDAHIVQAMRRKYPNDPPTEIRYDQYKKCRLNIGAHAEALAADVLPSDEKVANAGPIENVAFANSPESKSGLNRPETTTQSQIVSPLDMDSLQEKLFKALANMLWKKAIKPVIVNGAPPVSGMFEALPDLIFPEEALSVGNAVPPSTSAVKFTVNQKLQGEQEPKIDEPIAAKETADPDQSKNPMSFNDCMMVTKAFERGSAYATSEEAVFAMLTPTLQTMITQTNAAKNQIDSSNVFSSVKNTVEKINDGVTDIIDFATGAIDTANDFGLMVAPPPAKTTDLGSAGGDGEPLFTDFVPVNAEGEREWDRIFDSKCVPCGFRLSLADQALGKFAELGNDLWEQMISWFQQMLKNIDDILKFFDTLGSGEQDICQFIKFTCEFVCVPDIMKILAMLSALLLKLSTEFSSLFDMILGLIAPLVQPILSSLMTSLHQMMMMIVKPIECIIDSIVAMLRKLDYNTIFQNSGSFTGKFSAGPLQGGQDVPNNDRPTVPLTDIKVGPDTVKTGTNRRSAEVEANFSGPINTRREEEQKDLADARENLDTAQRSGANVDATDPAAVEAHNARVDQAQDEYATASREANESTIGTAANAVESLKPMLQQLVGYMEEIMAAIASFESKLSTELQKIMGQYLGGTGSALHTNFKKLGIIQMINILTGLLKLLGKFPDCNCDEPDAIESVGAQLANGPGLTFWTDEDGTVHIEETEENTEAATDAIIVALGGAAGDKPGSVLKSTGDPLLDTEIAKTVEALTTPVSITLRCQKQTTVANAEQVNQWIAELDQES